MTFATAQLRSLLPAATFVMAGEFLMGLADLVVAGHLLGESALGALNLLQPVFNIISFLALLIGTGTSVLFATAIGGFREHRAHELFTQGLWSVFGLGALLALALALGLRPLFALSGASADVTALANDYGLWFLACAVLEPLAVFLANMCYTDGDSRVCYIAYGVQLVFNFLVAIPLVRAFGIAGCAQASVLGHLAACAVMCGHFLRKGNNLRLVRHFSLADTARLCWCSAGDASLKLCYAALFFILNLYVVRRFGTEMLPVLAVVVTVLGVAEVFDGVGVSVQPLAGVYIGERNDVRTCSVMNTALLVALGEGLAVTLVLLLAPRLVTGLVGLDDPALVPLAETAVRYAALGLVATAVMMLFNSYYTLVEREGLAALLTVFTMLLAPAALIPVLGALQGADGVWLALGLAPTLAVLVFALVLCWRNGRARFPYLLDPARRANIRVFDLALDPIGVCAASAAVAAQLKAWGLAAAQAVRASLLVEETLMVVHDRNAGRRIRAEVTIDRNDGLSLVLRDDGEIFDLTDADARISSLRSYLVSNLMTAIPNRRNLTTTGFNRNVFKL